MQQAAGQDFRVSSYQLLTSNGGRVGWSPGANNLIAFDRQGASGYYDVWTMNPDGTNQLCLTCGKSGAPTLNKGNPDWHPSGQWIVFQAQRDSTTDPGITYSNGQTNNAEPGVGVANGLWIMDAGGSNYYSIPESFGSNPHNTGVLHPHFSHDGTKLIWGQALSINLLSQTWEIQVADFSIVNGIPQIMVHTPALQPNSCQSLYETHGFSRDDSTIFFTGGSPSKCSSTFGFDIFSYNLNSGVLTDLTNSPNDWDEHSRPMPNIDKLVWVSSMETTTTGPLNLQNEYWMMDYDGSNKKRVTWFTDSRAPVCDDKNTTPACFIPVPGTSLGPVASDSDWNHDGTQFVAYLINPQNGTQLGGAGAIYLLTIEPSSTTTSTATYARPPVAHGSILTSFGTKLATESASAEGSVPTKLGGTTATVLDVTGTTRNAQLFFASAGQVNWFLPDETAPGPAIVTTTASDGSVLRDTFDVENTAPGIFTANATGSGPPAAYLQVFPAGQTSAPLQYVFDCGSASGCNAVELNLGNPSDQPYLILFATGTVHHSSSVAVTVGTQTLTAAFDGAQGDLGLDQINVLLPHSLAGTGLQNVYLTVDGVVSNAVQLSF